MPEKFLKITQPHILQLEENLQSLLEQNSNELECEILGFLFAKSKRLRPVFTYLCAILFDGKIDEDIQNLALAVELLHSATLVHDDILDESLIRRGKESFFSLLGAKKSVVIGDYLLSLALLKLSEIKNPKIIQIFAKNILNTVNGEINQFENCFNLQDKDSYLKKTALKTASLFVCCAQSVCELKGASEKQTQKLYNFALKFGTLFQLKNDVDNFKNSGSEDIKNGIYTLCPIYLKQENPNCDMMNLSEQQKQNYIVHAQKDLDNFAKEAILALEGEFDQDKRKYLIQLCEKFRG